MSLALLLTFAIAVIIAANAYHETGTLRQALASRHWPTANANVVYKDAFIAHPYARYGGPMPRMQLCDLHYSYVVNGVSYSSCALAHVGKGTRLITHVFVGRVAVEGPPQIPIYYNPRNAAVSVIKTGARISLYAEVMTNWAALAIAISVALIVGGAS